MALLEVNDIHTYYGNIHALKGVSFKVDAGEIIALIGSNGAGKTTTLRTISGLMEPSDGSVTYDGQDISTTRADLLVSKGISMVPEGRGVFAKLTVEENLDMGAYTRRRRRHPRRPGGRIRAFPPFGRAQEAARRHLERWRAADACHCARADVETTTSLAR